ncbi:MAG: hypothetical protein NTW79_01700 [Candidatus Berkelbacteria bacterium]|nr:hypothetical protein [Candidatus Berkelbacteria bacterium]
MAVLREKSQTKGLFKINRKVPEPCAVFETVAKTSVVATKKDPERSFLVLFSLLPLSERKKSPKLYLAVFFD